jgi:uncharacterized protein (TIGR03118 family)
MFALGGLFLVAALSTPVLGAGVNSYVPTILTSDIQGLGQNTDPNLKNPWGLSYSTTSPFWNSDQATGLSTLYNAAGVPQSLVVTIPGGGTPPFTGPTGTVQNSTNNDFPVGNGGNGNKASFIFDTLNGTIAAWNGGGTAITQQTVVGASFTGLTLANAGTQNQPQNQLYAADFNATTGSSSRPLIDVFDRTFTNVTSTTAFIDPKVPAGLHPYNIQLVTIPGLTPSGTVLVVTYRSPGAVAYFDVNGNPLGIDTTNSILRNPWGVALAPASFGAFGGDLLVGNVANDQINAFDPKTLAFLGTLLGPDGQTPVAIPGANSGGGLWALGFRQAGGTFDPNALYFNAGLNGGGNFFTDGLFGEITAVPEPASAILLGLGLILLLGVCRWVTGRDRRPVAQPLAVTGTPR